MKIIAVTQARTGSTRLPGKILKKINGKTLLQIHLERLKQSSLITNIVVATTINPEDEVIGDLAQSWGLASYKGSESDVLDRFYQAVKNEKPNWVVRVTSDCPLLDASLVDKVIACVIENDADYGSNGFLEHFPDGQDVEVFKFSALEKAWKEAIKTSDREHVTPYIRTNSDFNGGNLFKAVNYSCEGDFSKIRMTVDEAVDFELIQLLIQELGENKSWQEYTQYIIEHQLNAINGKIIRNEGFLKSLKND